MFGKFFSSTLGILAALMLGFLTLCGGCVFLVVGCETAVQIREAERRVEAKQRAEAEAKAKEGVKP